MLLRYSVIACDPKTKDVHGQVQFVRMFIKLVHTARIDSNGRVSGKIEKRTRCS